MSRLWLEQGIQNMKVRIGQFPDYYHGERLERALAGIAEAERKLASERFSLP